MVKKLRRKFILVMMVAVVCTLGLLIGAINLISYRSVVSTADQRIAYIAENGGSLDSLRNQTDPAGRTDQTPPEDAPSDSVPDDIKDIDDKGRDQKSDGLGNLLNVDIIGDEFAFDTRYFTVTFDAYGTITGTDVANIAMVEEDDAASMAQTLYDAGKEKGFSGDYRYMLVQLKSDTDAEGGVMYIFLDSSRDLSSFESFRNASILISLAGALLLFLLVTVISGYAVKPMAESYEKQKRFITEASHEIKTPIAIIQANTEVIEIEGGESDWTRGIMKQTKRLTELTDNLVTLSRMEEDDPLVLAQNVDLSQLVREAAESYEAPAVANNKELKVEISDGIHLTGDEKMLNKMVAMLMDNAIKYSADGSEIRISLTKNGHKKKLSVSNSVDSITPGEHPEMFDRFYRADSSHNSKKSGSGIGLTVVRSIAEAHGGRATAHAADGHTIEFTVEI